MYFKKILKKLFAPKPLDFTELGEIQKKIRIIEKITEDHTWWFNHHKELYVQFMENSDYPEHRKVIINQMKVAKAKAEELADQLREMQKNSI